MLEVLWRLSICPYPTEARARHLELAFALTPIGPFPLQALRKRYVSLTTSALSCLSTEVVGGRENAV